jgi:hypothetical protein
MQPGTLGEGGSRAGATRRVRKPWPLSSLRRRCGCGSGCGCSPTEPTLRECLSSFKSVAASASSGPLWSSSWDVSLSSQTKPDEPDLLNVCDDLCSPAMLLPLQFVYGVACNDLSERERGGQWYGPAG